MDVGEVKGKITADSSGFSASTESAKNDLKNMANEMIKAMRDVVREQTRAIQTIEQDKAKERQAVREAADAHRKAAEETQKAARAQADAQKKAADEAKEAARKQADAAREQENTLKRLAFTSGVALTGIMKTLKEAVSTTVEFRNAMMGLESIARGTGQDLDATKKAAQALSADGLMPLADAATGLKNLLATGFSLDEAIVLMERFKDSAAFGRQGSLEFGEAIRTATEGIKNGNSILVDNAGVTKNLSVMLQEAGISANELHRAASDVNVRMAIYNGILRETAHQTGDAAKLAGDLGGSLSKTSTSVDYFKNALGEAVAGPLVELLEIIQPIINGLTDWVEENETLAGSIAVLTTALLGLITVATSAKLLGGLAALKTAVTALGSAVAFLFTTLTGGIITAIVGVTAAVLLYNSEQKKSVERTREAARAGKDNADNLENLRTKYVQLTSAVEKSKKGTEQHKKAQEELNQVVRDINKLAPGVKVFYDNMGTLRINDMNLVQRQIDLNRRLYEEERANQKAELQHRIAMGNNRAEELKKQLASNNEAIQRGTLPEGAGLSTTLLYNLSKYVGGSFGAKYREALESRTGDILAEYQQVVGETEADRAALRALSGGGTTTPKPGGDKSKKNEALEKAWADFEIKEASLAKEAEGLAGDAKRQKLFASYGEQIKFLAQKVLVPAKTQEEKNKVNDEIFRLIFERYDSAEEKYNWTAVQKLKNLDNYTTGYASNVRKDFNNNFHLSLENLKKIEDTRRALQIQVADEQARAKDEAYQADMEAYTKATEGLELSTEDKLKLYKQHVADKVALDKRSAEAKQAIELQLLVFERQIINENMDMAKDNAGRLEELRIEALKLEGKAKDAEIATVKKRYLEEEAEIVKNEKLLEERASKVAALEAKNARGEIDDQGLQSGLDEIDAWFLKQVEATGASSAAILQLRENTVSELLAIDRQYQLDEEAARHEADAKLYKSLNMLEQAAISEENAAWIKRKNQKNLSFEEDVKIDEEHRQKLIEIAKDFGDWRLAFEIEQAQKLEDVGKTALQKERDRELRDLKSDYEANKKEAEGKGASPEQLKLLDTNYLNDHLALVKKYNHLELAQQLELNANLAEAQGDSFTARLLRERANLEQIQADGELNEEQMKVAKQTYLANIANIRNEANFEELNEQDRYQADVLRAKGDFMEAERIEERMRFRKLLYESKLGQGELEEQLMIHLRKMSEIKTQGLEKLAAEYIKENKIDKLDPRKLPDKIKELEERLGKVKQAMEDLPTNADSFKAFEREADVLTLVLKLLGVEFEEYTKSVEEAIKNEIMGTFYGGLPDAVSEFFDALGGGWADIGKLVRSLEIDIKALEDPAKRVGDIFKNWRKSIISMGLDALANGLAAGASLIRGDWRVEGTARGESSFENIDEMRRNFQNWDDNKKRLEELQRKQYEAEAGGALGGMAAGAKIGSLLPGVGTLLGAAVGGLTGWLFGKNKANSWQEEVDKLKEQLEDTFEKIAEFLGTAISDIADGLKSAFSADTYSGFVQEFALTLEDMTKEALINAFLASEVMRPVMEGLSDIITLAAWDGQLTPEEIEAIKQQMQLVTDSSKIFFESLKDLYPANGKGPFGGIRNKLAGTQISEITGPTRDILISLLSPLKSLDILPGLFDSLRTAIYEMRDAFLGYDFGGLMPAPAGGAFGDTFMIDTLVIETSVTNATDLDALMRTMGERARVVVRGSGG